MWSPAWRVLMLDGATAQEQMTIDDALAREARPTLRLFRWPRPAFSMGRNQLRPVWLDGVRMDREGVDMVDRPTGGGLALHGSDLSCSVVVPQAPGLRLSFLMAWICRTMARAFGEAGYQVEWVGELPSTSRVTYCLAQTSSYALMTGGRKFGGFAIRRYPRSLLVQGSCALEPFPERLLRVMSDDAARAYAEHSTWLGAEASGPVEIETVMRSVARAWTSDDV